MLPYCLKCKKNTKSKKVWESQKQKKGNQCFYQNVKCVAEKIEID